MDFTQEQIREILTQVASQKDGFNKVLTLSLESLMNAERQLWNEERGDVSNGFRPRRVFGQGKMLELSVPRTRHGNFYPMLLLILKDQQEEAQQLVYQLYRQGLTTEQIGETFEIVYGKHYSTSQISHLMSYAKEEIQCWLGRRLDSYYPIIYIDAVHIHTRRVDQVSKEAYYTVLGVKSDTTREVLSVVNAPNENATIWKQTFEQLKLRGVCEVGLVVSDHLSGIENAVSTCFPGASHQLCIVHLERNISHSVKPSDKPLVSKDLKEVFDPDQENSTPEQGYQKFLTFILKWKKKYPSLAKYEAPPYQLHFTYLSYHVTIRRMIYSTNWIERLNRSYRRTTNMRAALPNVDAVLFLLGSVARHHRAYDYPIPAFKNEKLLFKN